MEAALLTSTELFAERYRTLYESIFDKWEGDYDIDELLSDVCPSYMNFALEALSERERIAIVLRCFGGKTHKEIAATLDLSIERARQIYAKALRKLRDPSRIVYFNAAAILEERDDAMHEVSSLGNEVLELQNEIKRLNTIISKFKSEPSNKVLLAKLGLLDFSAANLEMLVEELDLSVRSYNHLKRAGLNKVGQVAKLTK